MKNIKKLIAIALTGAMVFSMAACGGSSTGSGSGSGSDASASSSAVEEAPETDDYVTKVAALKGPTGMGLSKLMYDQGTETTAEFEMEEGAEAWTQAETDTFGASFEFTLAGAADEITGNLISGNLDIACVPANLASVLYNKSEGNIQVLGVNTLGVLYIVTKGEDITSMEDLRGKTIVSAGKGSTPEYALRYLLSENGIDPDNDVTLEWKSEHSECVAALASDQATIAMLPQPFVAAASAQVEGLTTVLDLTEEWDKLDNGSSLITGIVVANRTYVEEHEGDVQAFLSAYAESVDWVNQYNAEAGQLIAGYEIVASPQVAAKVIPQCNIVCITGSEMKDKLSGYLQVLFDADASAVGGALPGDDFYYGA